MLIFVFSVSNLVYKNDDVADVIFFEDIDSNFKSFFKEESFNRELLEITDKEDFLSSVY